MDYHDGLASAGAGFNTRVEAGLLMMLVLMVLGQGRWSTQGWLRNTMMAAEAVAWLGF